MQGLKRGKHDPNCRARVIKSFFKHSYAPLPPRLLKGICRPTQSQRHLVHLLAAKTRTSKYILGDLDAKIDKYEEPRNHFAGAVTQAQIASFPYFI